MKIEIPDETADALRAAFAPLIDRFVEERIEQRRPMLLKVTQVAQELSCSRTAVYGLIHGGHLETIAFGREHRVATDVLKAYVGELVKPTQHRQIVSLVELSSRQSIKKPHRHVAGAPRFSTVRAATKPPRLPRVQKTRHLSKKEIAEQRWTIKQLADQWWGISSANALLATASIQVSNDDAEATFRYGDLVEWMEKNRENFYRWVERFDPYLARGGMNPTHLPSNS